MSEKIEKAISLVQAKADNYPASYVTYWIMLETENYKSEIEDISNSDYCENCIDVAIKEHKRKIAKGLEKKLPTRSKLSYSCDNTGSISSNDFAHCEMCGLILVSSFDVSEQELEHWESLTDNEFLAFLQDDSTHYELKEIFEQHEYSKFASRIEKLADRVIKKLDNE